MRDTFVLGLPLVFAQLATMSMNVINTLLAGWHHADTLAGVAVGSAVWALAVLAVIGMLMAIPPTVSRLNGADKRHAVGAVFRQALWMAAILGALLVLGLTFIHPLMDWLGIAADVRPHASAYLKGITWGAPALAGFYAMRYLSEGVGVTKPTMIISFAGLFLLLPLGYALAFGIGGFPALGAHGLGLSTSVVLWLEMLVFLALLLRGSAYQDLFLFERFTWPRWDEIKHLVFLGLPMGVSTLMEGGLFVAAALFIGRLGRDPVAAHQIALNVSAVTFMLPLGLALASTVRVGYAMGTGIASNVRHAVQAGFIWVMITQTISAVLLLLFARHLAELYTNDLTIITMAVPLMILAAIYQWPDGIQVMINGVLRGFHDTTIPMFISVVAYWVIGMPVGVYLAMQMGLGARGMWMGLIAGLTAAAILLSWRLFITMPRAIRSLPHK